jgi:hypothetical protein
MTKSKQAWCMTAVCALLIAWTSTAALAADFGPALKLWHQQADQGNAQAQKDLGDCYANGWGVTRDPAQALTWYLKAAEQQNADAQGQLGQMYEAGEGVKADPAKAYMWYSLAAAIHDQFGARARFKMLADKMTPEQIAEGKRLASAWKPTSSAVAPTPQTCTPTESDFASLAASPSKLTSSGFSALTPAQQKSVCSTRAFIKEVDAQGGVFNTMGSYSTKYLSSAENDRIVEASNDYLERIMKSKGY